MSLFMEIHIHVVNIYQLVKRCLIRQYQTPKSNARSISIFKTMMLSNERENELILTVRLKQLH